MPWNIPTMAVFSQSCAYQNPTQTMIVKPVTDRFPSQKPVTRSFDIFFDLRLNKRLSK